MRYELYYWSSIQGRGEFVRLALEEVGADYVDVARQPGGEAEMMRLVDGEEIARPSFAPPFLKAGALLIGQTANILLYLGGQHGLAPAAEAGRLWAHQLQLTIADFVDEAHDTHHPIAGSLYYEDQRKEALARAADFRRSRMPKYLGYFETSALAQQFARRASCRGAAELFRPIAVPDRGGAALRLPQGDGRARTKISAGRRVARPDRGPPARRRLSCLGPPHPVQPARHLPPLSRTRRQLLTSPPFLTRHQPEGQRHQHEDQGQKQCGERVDLGADAEAHA